MRERFFEYRLFSLEFSDDFPTNFFPSKKHPERTRHHLLLSLSAGYLVKAGVVNSRTSGMRPTIRVDRLLGSLAQRNPQSLVFLAFSALCVFFLTYRFLFSSNVYRTEKQAAANPIYDRSAPFNINHKTPTSEDALPDPLEANNIPNVDSTFWSKIDTLLVIPGGGSGLPLHNASSAKSTAFETAGYPEWTRRRTSTAFEFYQTHRKSNGNKDNEESSAMEDSMVFLALSAGSLNAPNVLFDDRRVMFECQHTMQHLLALGVHPKR